MLKTRVIPALQMRGESLVKTCRFGRFTYVGDPCNTCRIFNELEVDELLLLDITATIEGREPQYQLLADIADECFMPLAYGGGVRSLEQAQRILRIGFEKIVVNSAACEDPGLVSALAERLGSQAVMASIDVRRDLFGRPSVWSRSGSRRMGKDPVVWARELEHLGAGEILLTSIDREGTWSGLDIELIRSVASTVQIPVIAHGGAGSIADIASAVRTGGASAVALGSMVVFQKKGMGVLIGFPDHDRLEQALA